MYRNVLKFCHIQLRKIHELYYPQYLTTKQVPVAARSKAWVCGRSPAEIAGSNRSHGCPSLVSVLCCQVEVCATG